MSEETSSSEPSSEIVRPEPSPEPSVSPPPSGGKKKLWMVIAAVVVVALLIGSSMYIMFLAPMKVSVSPDEFTVDAGKVLTVSAKIKKGLSDITDSDDVKILWTVSPNNLGSWQKRAEPTVNLTAGKVGAMGTVYCNVTYKGETKSVSKAIEIKPPYLDQILVLPSTKTLDKGMAYDFSASAIDSVATPIPDLVYTWAITGTVAGECTLNTTTGAKVHFTAGPTYGDVKLTATATYGGATKTGEASVVIGPLPPRSVDYYWYDMFDVPFGEWWYKRAEVYNNDVPLTDEYPYLFLWTGEPAGNTWIYSNMRLNITGSNMSEINMNSRPEFLPLSGIGRGGTAEIDWHMKYLTTDEMNSRFPDATAAWNDGWAVSLTGTVTLDEQASLTVLRDLTLEGFNDFDNWWAQKKGIVKDDFGEFFKREAGKDRLDIFPAYDYAFTTMFWGLDAEKVGDKIVLTYDHVSWGMEVLITMWMREAFMPTEWYFEDMNFHATIGPEWTQLRVETAVAYAVYSYEATNVAEEPCWVWEALVQDYIWAEPPANRESLFNKYIDPNGDGDFTDAWTYLNTAPGSVWYGDEMPFDYVPTCWNLTENETLRLKWPSGEQMFVVHVDAGVTGEHMDEMVVNYSEPYWSDADFMLPGSFSINNLTKELVFTGPIDMWDFSRNQTNPEHSWLSSEWERMGLLPYGAPYIEFNAASYGKYADKLKLAATTNWDDWEDPMATVGEDLDLSVTILHQFGGVFLGGYDSTVSFSSNRTDLTLPDDYTFSVSDSGVAVVTGLSFSGFGWYNISVADTTPDTEVKIGFIHVYVVEDPPVIDHFTVEVPGVNGLVLPGLSTSVHVWAHSQYEDRLFKKYDGTVTFSTDAELGTYTLPADYTFGGAASKGYAVIPGLVFTESGTFVLDVADTVVTTATGTTSVTVGLLPQVDYRMYDLFEEPWGEWWPYRLPTYKTDIILNDEPHAYTMVYNPDGRNLQGIIMAPYRWNVSAYNMSTVSVNDPSIMPVFGPEVEGASAQIDVYFQYLYLEWWENYWVATWESNPGWNSGIAGLYAEHTLDGYTVGTVYDVRMNREAAETWMNMPQSADPLTWWGANRENYITGWVDWILDQGNVLFDIFPGYEYAYFDLGTLMDLEVDGDDIVLSIGHLNWGYEVLITRWMTDRAICTHEPYMEDFQLNAQFESDYGNVTYDGVAQWNLHAVRANDTESDAAWVWEPQNIDYFEMEGSDYNPWAFLQYTSWNSGDQLFGTYVGYDFTPTYFNLTSYMTMTVQLPDRDDVIGYRGLGLPAGTIRNLRLYSDAGPYENISHYGPMWLGWHCYPEIDDAPDLSSMYDNSTKVLFMQGPLNFVNYLQPNETGESMVLYHSAPWIEFNVANYTWPGGTVLAASSPEEAVVAEGPMVASTSATPASMYAAMVALAIAITLSIVATDAVMGEVRREED